MKPLLLISSLLCLTDGLHANFTGTFVPAVGVSVSALHVSVSVNVSALIRRVDPRFLSVTIDASLAAEEKFMYLLK